MVDIHVVALLKKSKICTASKTHNNQRQSDSQRYAPFVLLAGAQTLTQKVLRAGCACAGRYIQGEA